jgi:hypothetical protein
VFSKATITKKGGGENSEVLPTNLISNKIFTRHGGQ